MPDKSGTIFKVNPVSCENLILSLKLIGLKLVLFNDITLTKNDNGSVRLKCGNEKFIFGGWYVVYHG